MTRVRATPRYRALACVQFCNSSVPQQNSWFKQGAIRRRSAFVCSPSPQAPDRWWQLFGCNVCTCALGRVRCPATLKFLGRGHFRARMCGPTQALALFRVRTHPHTQTRTSTGRTLVSLKTFTGLSWRVSLKRWVGRLVSGCWAQASESV